MAEGNSFAPGTYSEAALQVFVVLAIAIMLPLATCMLIYAYRSLGAFRRQQGMDCDMEPPPPPTPDYNEDAESAAVGGARRALLSGQPSSSSSLPTYDAVANNDDNNEWKWDGRR